METYKVKAKNGNIITMKNEVWETKNAWGHKTNVYINGFIYNIYKCEYFNRTWEEYAFKCCMFGAINNLINDIINNVVNSYKEVNNISAFKRGQKQKVISDFKANNKLIQDLEETLDRIRQREFDYDI